MAEAEEDSGGACEGSEMLQIWDPECVEMEIPFSPPPKEVVPGEISSAPTDAFIYMQSGCSLLENSGHTDDKEQRLVKQLDQQQVAEAEEEVVLNLEPGDSLARDLKGYVNHGIIPLVEAPLGTNNSGPLRDPMTFMQNAAQQLQSVAQHVALQNKLNAVTRLVQQKLESIQIQIQPLKMKESHEKPVPSLAAINPQNVKLVQPLDKTLNCSGLNPSPQVIQIQPLTGNGEQKFILQRSLSHLPIQLLVQRTLPHVGPASFAKETNPHMVPTISADVAFTEDKRVGSLEKKQKLKKSLKVKTRSGRISRPPKHKAKDYKFIKTGDLADGHPSDSDDYSELSVEEEGDATKKDVLFNSSNYILKPKTFKCESCEKCYIGKGGLARHYKLNPEHGNVNYVEQKAVPMINGNNAQIVVDSVGKHYASGNLSHGVACTNHESIPLPHAEEMDSICGQQSGKSVEADKSSDPLHEDNVKVQWLPPMNAGPGRPKGCIRTDRTRKFERSRRRSRCPLPANSLACARVEHHILQRKSRLKELLQECEIEDLIELALPLLAKLVTVYQFLIMKVEKGHPAKPFFPDVYREFEKLHEAVQNMAQDHFNNFSYLNIQQTLEITNQKVAESLGIKEKKNRNENRNLTVSCDSSLKEGSRQLNMDISHQNPAHACPEQENVPPAKKMKSQNVCKNKLNICAGQNDLEKNNLNSIQSAQKGSVWQQNEIVSASEKKSVVGEDICLETYSASNTSSHTQTCKEFSNQKAGIDSSNSELLLCPAYERLDYSQSVSFTQRSEGNFPNSKTQPEAMDTPLRPNCKSKGSADHHFENQNSTCKALNSETSVSMPLVNIADGQILHPPNGQLSQHIDQGLQQDAINQCTLKVHVHSELNGTIDHIQHLEDTFSGNLPTDNQFLYKTQSESSIHILQPSVTSKLKHSNELQCTGKEESNRHSELENVVNEVECISFDIANEGHELFTQGYEQLFIPATDGLVMSCPGTSVLPQPEGIFIVTNGDGTTMHISTPGGVSLETVEALLAMEADGQSEAILISQSDSE
ncbi:zinc finger protein 839 isoform X2 [Pleurodeles waltl]|uniref:zinc finger protein 839 isoform X2 n=1 Tax=Pleurodeles waltl TaxID=8319 RepID=UPI003709B78B